LFANVELRPLRFFKCRAVEIMYVARPI